MFPVPWYLTRFKFKNHMVRNTTFMKYLTDGIKRILQFSILTIAWKKQIERSFK